MFRKNKTLLAVGFTLLGISLVASVSELVTEAMGADRNIQRFPAAPAEEIKFRDPTITLGVSDVQASIDFYGKLGFVQDWIKNPAAGEKLTDAGIKGGSVRIVLTQSDATEAERAARRKFQISMQIEKATAASLVEYHDRVAGLGMKASDFDKDARGLSRFTVEDPDGYIIAFLSNVR